MVCLLVEHACVEALDDVPECYKEVNERVVDAS